MMRQNPFWRDVRSLVALTMLMLVSSGVLAASEIELREAALTLVKQYAGELKPALIGALQDGGPEHAVAVCAEKAPAIGAALAAASGWQVSRISSRPRNQQTAVPGDWEAAVLNDFDRRQQAGEPVSTLEHSVIVGNEYRFLKAQPVEGVCILCHGKNIPPTLRRVIEEKYPGDQALGYSPGEVRGAFRLVKVLDGTVLENSFLDNFFLENFFLENKE